MGIAGDPRFAGPEPKERERDEWFEDVLRAGREAEEGQGGSQRGAPTL